MNTNSNYQPKISVIMSVYNDSKRVEDAILSIHEQTYKNYEFLILDDGSTDDTFDICRNYQKKYKKIKLFKNINNIGLTKSLNLLAAKADGEYLARQDSDDVSLPSRLLTQLTYMKEKNSNVCTTRAIIRDSKRLKPRFAHIIHPSLVIKYKNPFVHGTLMIDKKLFNKIGGYDDQFRYSQDFKLYQDVINNDEKIHFLNTVLYEVNIKDNISSKSAEQQKYYALCVKKNLAPYNYE